VKKSITTAEAGRLGGLKGGRSTSPKKLAAVRRNLAKARKIKLARLKDSA
jgi:hypothetical protein